MAESNIGKAKGIDLSPKTLAEKAKHDKILMVSEKVLEFFVEKDCTIEDVYAVLSSVQSVLERYYQSRKVLDVKEFFKSK